MKWFSAIILMAAVCLPSLAFADGSVTISCGTSLTNAIPCGTSSNPVVTKNTATTAALTPLGYCQLTLGSSAVSLSTCSGGVPSGATYAAISIETANIRWRDDGTSPTTSVGMPVLAGQGFNYSGTVTAIQFIAQSGSPVLDVSFYK